MCVCVCVRVCIFEYVEVYHGLTSTNQITSVYVCVCVCMSVCVCVGGSVAPAEPVGRSN